MSWSLGVANSVFSDTGFDAERAILWAAQHGFNPVQLYLNLERLPSAQHANRIRNAALSHSLSLISHADGLDLFHPDRRNRIFEAAHRLLEGAVSWNALQHVVWHIDPEQDLESNLEVHESIISAGLVSAPENWYRTGDPGSFRGMSERTGQIWRQRDAVPVMDLARFFAADAPDPLKLSGEAIASACGKPHCILHVIDGSKPLSDRRGWCPPGQGICSWPELTRMLRDTIPGVTVIFEYEDRTNPVEAKHWFEERL